MGLRDYEFDVAPELVAAMVRGRPGPLMDAALAHIGNLAEAARDVEQSAQNARDRAMVEGVEESIAASLERIDTVVGNGVGRPGGAFAVRGVGGSVGDVNRMGTDLVDSTTGRGRGGNRGRIPIGKTGLWIRGTTPQDFIQGLLLGGRGRVTEGENEDAENTYPGRSAFYRQQMALYDAEAADDRADEARARRSEAQQQRDLWSEQTPGPPVAAGGAEYWLDYFRSQVAYWDHQAFYWSNLAASFRDNARRVQRDNPDDPGDRAVLDNAVDAMALWMRLQSLNGLGYAERLVTRFSGARAPAIFNAINPAPDDNSSSGGSEFDHWIFDLIDPVDPTP